MSLIVVLNDGETFTNAEGCKIVEVEDSYLFDTEAIESALKDLRDGNDAVGLRVLARFE